MWRNAAAVAVVEEFLLLRRTGDCWAKACADEKDRLQLSCPYYCCYDYSYCCYCAVLPIRPVPSNRSTSPTADQKVLRCCCCCRPRQHQILKETKTENQHLKSNSIPTDLTKSLLLSVRMMILSGNVIRAASCCSN